MAAWMVTPWLEDFLLKEEHSVEITKPRKCQIVQKIAAPNEEREDKACALVSDKHLFIKAIFTQDSIQDYFRRFEGKSLEDLHGVNICLTKYSFIPQLDCDQNQIEFELHVFGFGSPGGSKSAPFGGTIAHASRHDPIEAKLRCLWRQRQIRNLNHFKFVNRVPRLKECCKKIRSEDEELFAEIPEWRPEFIPPSSLTTDQSESGSVDQQSLQQSNSISAAFVSSANVSLEPAEGIMGEALSVPSTETKQHSLVQSSGQQNLSNPSCKENSQRRIFCSPEQSFETNLPLPGAMLDFVSANEADNVARCLLEDQPVVSSVEQASENQIERGSLSPCFPIIHKKSDVGNNNPSKHTSLIPNSTKKSELLCEETNVDGEGMLKKKSEENVTNCFAVRSDFCTASVNQNQEVPGESSGDGIEQKCQAGHSVAMDVTSHRETLPKETYAQLSLTQGSKKRPGSECDEFIKSKKRKIELVKEVTTGDVDAEYHYIEQSQGFAVDNSQLKTFGLRMPKALQDATSKTVQGNTPKDNAMLIDTDCNQAIIDSTGGDMTKMSLKSKNDAVFIDAARNEAITDTNDAGIIKQSDKVNTPKNDAMMTDASRNAVASDTTGTVMTKENDKGASSCDKNQSFSVSQSQNDEMTDHQSETPKECRRGTESVNQPLPGLLSSILTTDRVFGDANLPKCTNTLDFAKMIFWSPKISKRVGPGISEEGGVVDSKKGKVLEDQEESVVSNNDQMKNFDNSSGANLVSDLSKDVCKMTAETIPQDHSCSEQMPDEQAQKVGSQRVEYQQENHVEINTESESQNVDKHHTECMEFAITENGTKEKEQEAENSLKHQEDLDLAPEDSNVGKNACLVEDRQDTSNVGKNACLVEDRQDTSHAALNSGGTVRQISLEHPSIEEESVEKLSEKNQDSSNITHNDVNQQSDIVAKNQSVSQDATLVAGDVHRIDLTTADDNMDICQELVGQNLVAKKFAVDLNMNTEYTARDTEPGIELTSKGAVVDITAELKGKASRSRDCMVELQVNTESGKPAFETAIDLNPVAELPSQYTVVQEDVTIVLSKPCDPESQEISSVSELIECMAYSPKRKTQEHYTLPHVQEQEHFSQAAIFSPREPHFQGPGQGTKADEIHSTPTLTQLAAYFDQSQLTQLSQIKPNSSSTQVSQIEPNSSSTQVSQPGLMSVGEPQSLYVDLEAIAKANDSSSKNTATKEDTSCKMKVKPVRNIQNCSSSNTISCGAKSGSENIPKPLDHNKNEIKRLGLQGDLSQNAPSATQLGKCLAISQADLDSQRRKIVTDDIMHRGMTATAVNASQGINSQNTSSATQLARCVVDSQADSNSQCSKIVIDNKMHDGESANANKVSQVSKSANTQSVSQLAKALVDSQLKSVPNSVGVSSDSKHVSPSSKERNIVAKYNTVKVLQHSPTTQTESQADEIEQISEGNLVGKVAGSKNTFRPPRPKKQDPPNPQGTQDILSLTQLADCLIQSQATLVSQLTGPAKKQKFVLSQSGTQSVYVDLEAIVRRERTRNKEHEKRGRELKNIKESRERVGKEKLKIKDIITGDKETTTNNKQSRSGLPENNVLYVDDTSKRGTVLKESNQQQQKTSSDDNKTVEKDNGKTVNPNGKTVDSDGKTVNPNRMTVDSDGKAGPSSYESLTPISLSSIEADDVIGLSKIRIESSRSKASGSSYEESQSTLKTNSQHDSSADSYGARYPVLKLSSSTSSSDEPEKNHQPTPSRLLDQSHLRKSTKMQNEQPHIPFQVTSIEICDSQSQSQGTEYFSAEESLDDKPNPNKRKREPEDIEVDTVTKKISKTRDSPLLSPKTRKKETFGSVGEILTLTSKDQLTKGGSLHKDEAEQFNQKPTNKGATFYFNSHENKMTLTSTAEEKERKRQLEEKWPSEKIQKSISNFWNRMKTEQKAPRDLSMFERFHPKKSDC